MSKTFPVLFFTSVSLILLLSLSATATTTACIPPQSSLVGWWPGDGNAKNLADSNDGVLGGGVSFDTGKVAQAFRFDGIDDYVQIPDDGQGLDLDGYSQLTIDAWIYPYSEGWSNPDGGFTSAIVSKYDSTAATGASYYLSLQNGKLRLVIFQSVSPVSLVSIESNDVVELNAWSHVAGVWQGETNLGLFVNGAQVDATLLNEGTVPTTAANNNTPVNIGRIESFGGSSSGPGAYFHGLIDEADIFNRALSTNEIQAIANAGSEGKCKSEVIPTNSPTSTPISDDDEYLPIVLKPLPTSTLTPTPSPTPTPSSPPTPRPLLHDGDYLADFGGNGSLWFTVSQNGTLASGAGYSFYDGTPWCGWSTNIFEGVTTINDGQFTFSYVLEDNHIPIYFATLECTSTSTTQATCLARDWWVQFGPCSIAGAAFLK